MELSATKSSTKLIGCFLILFAIATFIDRADGSFSVGSSLTFVRNDKTFIDVGKQISFGGALTIEFYVKWRDAGPIIYLGRGSDKQDKIAVYIEGNGRIKFETCSNRQCSSHSTSNNVVSRDQWTWVSVVVTPGIFGIAIVSISAQRPTDLLPYHTSIGTISSPQTIQRTVTYIGREKSSYFGGDLDEVRLWGCTILLPLAQRPVNNNDRSLVARWSFDEGSGLIAIDSSRSQYHGSLGGGKSQHAPKWQVSTTSRTRSCTAWGRKIHMLTFDKRLYKQSSTGDFWFARSTFSPTPENVDDINVQIRFINQASRKGGLVGGVALKAGADTLFIDTDFNRKTDSIIYLNNTKYDHLSYSGDGLLVNKRYNGKSGSHVIDIEAPGSFKMVLRAYPRKLVWSSVSMRVSNPPYGSSLTGLCGDFNDSPSNDSPPSGFVIAPGASFFPTPVEQDVLSNFECEISQIADPVLRGRAVEICDDESIVDNELSDSCKYDVCITGDISGASFSAIQSYENCVENNETTCVRPCPNFCSFHGECDRSGTFPTCTCDEGWYGSDCSQQYEFQCYRGDYEGGSFTLYPFRDEKDVVRHYGYKAKSSNTKNEISDSTVIYLYEDTQVSESINLVMLHDKSSDGSGGRVDAIVRGYRTPSNQPISSMLLAVRDDPTDRYTVTGSTVSAQWEWNAVDNDGLALSGLPVPELDNGFCVDIQFDRLVGINQIYLSNENQFGQQDLQKVDTNRLSGLKVCGDKCINRCGIYSSCGNCTADPECGWCLDFGTCELGGAGGPADGRCKNWRYSTDPSVSRVSSSQINYPVDPSDLTVYLSSSSVLNAQFSVTFPAPSRTPLDVLILQDITRDFRNDVKNIRNAHTKLFDTVTREFPNTKFGYSVFSDKPLSPYGQSGADLVYANSVPLTTNKQVFVSRIDTFPILNGGDAKNAQLEALLHAAHGFSLGWGSNSRKVIVVVTQSEYHTPIVGDANLPNPNNGDASIESNENYPSIDQVRRILLSKNIVPIFIAPSGVALNSYRRLVDDWGFGYAISWNVKKFDTLVSLVSAAISDLAGSAVPVYLDKGKIKEITPVTYYGMSPDTRVFFNAELDPSIESNDPSVIVVPGYGTVTINYVPTDLPETSGCPFINVTTEEFVTFSLSGEQPVYGSLDGTPVRTFIVHAPTKGRLYQYEDGDKGDLITDGTYVTDPSGRVYYETDIGGDSGDTQLTYKVVDSCEGCSPEVTCTLFVVSAPEPPPIPPVASFPNPLVTLERKPSPPTPLNGTGIGPVRARITRFPTRGDLFQTDFQPLNLTHPSVNDPDNRVIFVPEASAPPAQYFDDFRYRVADEVTGLESNEEIVVIKVLGVPRPVANSQNVQTKEDTPKDIQLTAEPGDEDREELKFYLSSIPSESLLELYSCESLSSSCKLSAGDEVPEGRIWLSPLENQFGETEFRFYVVDNEDFQSNTDGVIRVTVEWVNDDPESSDGSASVVQDQLQEIVLPAASDVEDDPSELVYLIIWSGRGSLFLDASMSNAVQRNTEVALPSRTLYYLSPQFEAGSDSFVFRVRDTDNGFSDYYNFAITIQPVNYPPTSPSSLTFSGSEEDGDFIIQLVAQDNNLADHPLSFTISSLPSSPAQVKQFNGDAISSPGTSVLSFNSTARTSFAYILFGQSEIVSGNSTYTFNYCASDSVNAETCTTVTVEMYASVKLPYALSPLGSVDAVEDVEKRIEFTGDIDAPANAVVSFRILAFGRGHFSLDDGTPIVSNNTNVGEANAIRFQGLQDEFGVGYSYFIYQAYYESLVSGPYFVSIDVEAVNDPPTVPLLPIEIYLDENTDAVITLVAQDVEDGPANLKYFIRSLPTGTLLGCTSSVKSTCTVSVSVDVQLPSRHVLYVPPTNTNGLPLSSISYYVRDSEDAESANDGQITLFVRPVNRPPEVPATERNFNIKSNETFIITLEGSDSNPGDTITGIITQPPTIGSLYQVVGDEDQIVASNTTVLDGNRRVRFEAVRVEEDPTAIFKYILVDSENAPSLEVTVRITIENVNLPPVAYDSTANGVEDNLFPITLTGFDQPSGGPLRARIVRLPDRGDLYQFNDNGTDPITVNDTLVLDDNMRVKYIGEPDEYGDEYTTFDFIVVSVTTGLESDVATVTINLENDMADFPRPILPEPFNLTEDEWFLLKFEAVSDFPYDVHILQTVLNVLDGTKRLANFYQVNGTTGQPGAMINPNGLYPGPRVLNESGYMYLVTLPDLDVGTGIFRWYLRAVINGQEYLSNIMSAWTSIIAVNDPPRVLALTHALPNAEFGMIELKWTDPDTFGLDFYVTVLELPKNGSLRGDGGLLMPGEPIEHVPYTYKVVHPEKALFYFPDDAQKLGDNIDYFVFQVSDILNATSPPVRNNISIVFTYHWPKGNGTYTPNPIQVIEGSGRHSINFTMWAPPVTMWSGIDYTDAAGLDLYKPNYAAISLFENYPVNRCEEWDPLCASRIVGPRNDSIIPGKFPNPWQHIWANPNRRDWTFEIGYYPWANSFGATEDVLVYRECFNAGYWPFKNCLANSSIPIQILQVNDPPELSTASIVSDSSSSLVRLNLIDTDFYSPQAAQITPPYDITVSADSGASSVSFPNIDTLPNIEIRSQTSQFIDVRAPSLATAQALVGGTSGGILVTFAPTASSAQVIVTVVDNDDSRIGGTKSSTYTFVVNRPEGLTSEPNWAQDGAFAGALVGGTTVFSAGFYGIYRVLKKKKLLPEDADPWETDDTFDQTIDNPIYGGTGIGTAAPTSISLVTADN